VAQSSIRLVLYRVAIVFETLVKTEDNIQKTYKTIFKLVIVCRLDSRVKIESKIVLQEKFQIRMLIFVLK